MPRHESPQHIQIEGRSIIHIYSMMDQELSNFHKHHWPPS
jgi:hypothetical protein